MTVTIEPSDLAAWAGFLLHNALGGIGPDDVVMIKGEHVTWPLISVLQDEVVRAGGIPDVNLVAPDNDRGKVFGAALARHGTAEQIRRVPQWMVGRYEAMTKYVEILGAESPELFADLPAETEGAIATANLPLIDIRLAKPWVLTMFPTHGFAQLEGRDLRQYTEIVVRACTTSPVELARVERPLIELMERSEHVRIVTRAPDGNDRELTMRIAGQKIVGCAGENNFPGGEICTSPDANTVEGAIYVDLPVLYSGSIIRGISLGFEAGRIVEYGAEQGAETLERIVETDEGSHRLGEVALGMNAGLVEPLMHPLFAEKVGGTLHIAIGFGFAECHVDDPASDEGRRELERLEQTGVYNRSAQHVDIVTDFRPGGAGRAVFLDDVRLEIRDGVWAVPETS